MGALSIALAYGIDVKSENDPNIHYAEEAVKGLAGAANFSAFLVNSIPLLKHVPSWFPGAKWKKKAEMWSDWTVKMREIPFQQSLEQLVSLFCFRWNSSSYPPVPCWLLGIDGNLTDILFRLKERRHLHWSRTAFRALRRLEIANIKWLSSKTLLATSLLVWMLPKNLYPHATSDTCSRGCWHNCLCYQYILLDDDMPSWDSRQGSGGTWSRCRKRPVAWLQRPGCATLHQRSCEGNPQVRHRYPMKLEVLIHGLFLDRFQAITPFGRSWFVERYLFTNAYLWQLFPIT